MQKIWIGIEMHLVEDKVADYIQELERQNAAYQATQIIRSMKNSVNAKLEKEADDYFAQRKMNTKKIQ